ncbi:hypothetical protein [Halosimplex sp. J119]
MASTERSSDGLDPFKQALASVFGSTFLTIAAFGVVLVLIGRFLLNGTIAGMFGIWGATAVLIGLVGLPLQKYIYRP